MTPVQIIEAAAQELEASGFEVWFEDGWQDRGRPGDFIPQGMVWHHTADRAYSSDYAILGAIRDGIDQGGGYWLPGPLAQFGLGRSGRVYVIAAGKANHAGGGGWAGLSGNGTVWGCEAANDGIGEEWSAAQIVAYVSLATALARHTGFGAEMVCRHAEWSDAGKIDTATHPLDDGDWIRAQVQSRLDGDPLPPPQPQPDPEVPALFIFDAPSTRGGGIWYTDGATWKRGVPNGEALAPWQQGHVPHLGVIGEEYFDALPVFEAQTKQAVRAGFSGAEVEAIPGPIAHYAPAPLGCAGDEE